MKTIANALSDLGTIFGKTSPEMKRSVIPSWELKKIDRIDQMVKALKKALLPVKYDRRSGAFVLLKASHSDCPYRRSLWVRGEEWFFGDYERVYAHSTNLSDIISDAARWYNSIIVK